MHCWFYFNHSATQVPLCSSVRCLVWWLVSCNIWRLFSWISNHCFVKWIAYLKYIDLNTEIQSCLSIRKWLDGARKPCIYIKKWIGTHWAFSSKRSTCFNTPPFQTPAQPSICIKRHYSQDNITMVHMHMYFAADYWKGDEKRHSVDENSKFSQ